MFKKIIILFVLATTLSSASALSLEINGGSQTLDGTYNYDYVNITNGGVLYITPYDGTGTTGTLELIVLYDVNIDSTSKIIGMGKGWRGGQGTYVTPQNGEGNGQGGRGNTSGSGSGGGAGYGGNGGVGGGSIGGTAGTSYGSSDLSIMYMGSGGGAGRANSICGSNIWYGGNGGGSLLIKARTINMYGIINVDGSVGTNSCEYTSGGGGGGSGGSLFLNASRYLNITGATITSKGNDTNGGVSSNGGGGSGGRIHLKYGAINNVGTTTTVNGGTGYVNGNTGTILYTSQTFLNSVPTVPQISSPSNNSRHYNNSINFTWSVSTDSDSDTVTYDFWLSSQSDFSNTINRTNFTNNWTGNIATTNGITYYSKVRSNDSYTYSSWSGTVQFTENTVPSVVNITISPSNPSVTDNLTVSMNGSDAESDALTKHYLWYKNSVLQTTWNDSTYVNYTGNYTLNDQIYVIGYVNDGYENSTNLQSNSVTIGSGNSAPTFTSLTLIPSTKKNNQTININASGISDDSSTWQLQTYYKNGSTNVYISNSSWGSASFINITGTVPFTTGGAHIIYGVIYDSGSILTGLYNSTSSESQATFTSLTTDPTIESSSLSASSITVGGTVTITAKFNGQGANISSALVNVERPDATIANWTMTCDSGEIVNCTKSYTSTSDIGTYYIRYFYPTDNAGITAQISSILTFTASAAAVSSGGGGGGGGVVYINPTPSMTSSVNLSIIGITDGARSVSDVDAINKCLTDNFFLSNQCVNSAIISIKQQTNWYTLFGVYISSLATLFILGTIIKKKRSFLYDPLIYSVIIAIVVLGATLMGFNSVFIFNYLFNNSLSAFTFASFAMYGFIGTVLLDSYLKTDKIWEVRKINL